MTDTFSMKWVIQTIHEPITVFAAYMAFTVLKHFAEHNQTSIRAWVAPRKLFMTMSTVCSLNGIMFIFFPEVAIKLYFCTTGWLTMEDVQMTPSDAAAVTNALHKLGLVNVFSAGLLCTNATANAKAALASALGCWAIAFTMAYHTFVSKLFPSAGICNSRTVPWMIFFTGASVAFQAHHSNLQDGKTADRGLNIKSVNYVVAAFCFVAGAAQCIFPADSYATYYRSPAPLKAQAIWATCGSGLIILAGLNCTTSTSEKCTKVQCMMFTLISAWLIYAGESGSVLQQVIIATTTTLAAFYGNPAWFF